MWTHQNVLQAAKRLRNDNLSHIDHDHYRQRHCSQCCWSCFQCRCKSLNNNFYMKQIKQWHSPLDARGVQAINAGPKTPTRLHPSCWQCPNFCHCQCIFNAPDILSKYYLLRSWLLKINQQPWSNTCATYNQLPNNHHYTKNLAQIARSYFFTSSQILMSIPHTIYIREI